MKKRRYRSVPFTQVEPSTLHASVVALDIAKTKIFAALLDAQRETLCTVTFSQPAENGPFLLWLSGLQGSPDVVLEASGTYGDALVLELATAGHEVFQASAHRVHAAREVFDGVPSLHDAKSANVIARLHLEGATAPWRFKTESEKALNALLSLATLYRDSLQRLAGRFEAMLARHWPECPLSVGSASFNALMMSFPGPSGIAGNVEDATQLLYDVGGRFLSAKVPATIETALTTRGVAMLDEEQDVLRALATEAERYRQLKRDVEKRIGARIKDTPVAEHLLPVCGPLAAAVLIASVGDPRQYPSAGAFLKALGLNLKEKSSGIYAGPLHISKRGHGEPRRHLFLCVLRLLRTDEVLKSWYAAKVKRSGPKQGRKAVVALMRKLARGLWHCAKYDVPFNSSMLFDVARLKLDSSTLKEAA